MKRELFPQQLQKISSASWEKTGETNSKWGCFTQTHSLLYGMHVRFHFALFAVLESKLKFGYRWFGYPNYSITLHWNKIKIKFFLLLFSLETFLFCNNTCCVRNRSIGHTNLIPVLYCLQFFSYFKELSFQMLLAALTKYMSIWLIFVFNEIFSFLSCFFIQIIGVYCFCLVLCESNLFIKLELSKIWLDQWQLFVK